MLTAQAAISLTPQQLVNIFTTLNLGIMFFILFFRKNNSYPNRVLAVILLLPAVTFFGNFFLYKEDLFRFPGFVYLNQITSLLGPMLIAYYFSIFMGKRSWRTLVLNMLTIALIFISLIYLVRFYLQDSGAQTQVINAVIHETFPRHILVIRAAFFALMNVYFLNIAYEVYTYSKKVMNTQSDDERLRVRYLQHFIIIIWALNITVSVAYLLMPANYVDYYLVPVITNVFYFFLIRKSFNSNTVFSSQQLNAYKRDVSELNRVEVNESKSSIPEDKLELLQQKITELINQQKVFTQPTINLVKFAEMMGQPPHVVSAYLNQKLNTNFFSLINSKRIELAKEQFRKMGEKSEIEVTAFEVGFNSKSAFYRAFQKFSGQSPTAYIDSLT